MEHALSSPLAAWESFYVIVGSSAAALTGLQFVVIVLGSEVKALGDSTTRAFSTPTVVHFCVVLLISAVLSAPWPGLGSPGLCLGLCGAAGLAYVAMVIRQMRRQKDYVPVLEDWLWHGVFPLVAYVALFAAGLELRRHAAPCLFVIGGTALLLLFIGIHNAWDAVTYIALQRRPEGREDRK